MFTVSTLYLVGSVMSRFRFQNKIGQSVQSRLARLAIKVKFFCNITALFPLEEFHRNSSADNNQSYHDNQREPDNIY